MSQDEQKARENAMLIVAAAIKHLIAQSQGPDDESFDRDALAGTVSTARFCELKQATDVVDAGLAELARRHPEVAGPDMVKTVAAMIAGRSGPEAVRQMRGYATSGQALDDSVVASIVNLQDQAHSASQPIQAAQAEDEADEVSEPFNASLVDQNVARSLGVLIKKATNGQIGDAKELFRRLERAETRWAEVKASKRSHSAAVETGAAQAGDAPIWTSERKKLSEILDRSEIGGDGINIAQLLNSEVKVWSCSQRHGAIPRVDPDYMFDAKALAKALYAIDAGENLAFVGPPGCGKTTITKQLAARLGRPFYRIPIDGEMRRTEIIGGFKQVADANGSRTQWFDGLLTKGISEPSILDLDEIDRGDPDLLYAAHAALEREGVTILEDAGRYVPMHPDCVILATANTKGRADANGLYASVNEMSVATHDRIPFWHDCDYQSAADEAAMLVRKVKGLTMDDATKIANLAANLRTIFKEGQMRTSFSARQTIAAGKYTVSLMNSGIARSALKDAITAVFETRAVDSADESLIRENIGMVGL